MIGNCSVIEVDCGDRAKYGVAEIIPGQVRLNARYLIFRTLQAGEIVSMGLGCALWRDRRSGDTESSRQTLSWSHSC